MPTMRAVIQRRARMRRMLKVSRRIPVLREKYGSPHNMRHS